MLIDITGQTFGKLTVIRRDENLKREPAWLCKCSCGKELTVIGKYLRYGYTKDCGCSIDLTGKKFWNWTVLERVENDYRGCMMWLCRCGCGTEKILPGYRFRLGHAKSCGCVQRKEMTTHGMCGSPEYTAWLNMHQRCKNPKHHKYPSYGARNITVCDRWETFEYFYEDMGQRPSKKHSIDRINNDGNYEPSNCRWTTRNIQQSNRRNSRNKP